jgi:hypothetical protein
MVALRALIKQTLEADAPLMVLLPGGILDADELPRDGGGSASAPRQADEIRINPFAIVRTRDGNRTQMEIPARVTERETYEIYLYQDVGYDVIEQAIRRVIAVLNNQYLNATDRALAHLLYTFTSGEIPAEEFENAPCRFVRFQVNSIQS